MIKNKVRLWVLGFAVFLVSIVIASLSVINTSHAVGSNLLQNVVDKTYYYALSQCFRDGNVNHEVSTVNWAGISGVSGNNPGLLPTKSSNDYTILDSDLQAKKTNCINILLSDAIRSRGPEYGADPVEVGEFLKKTGYEPAKQTETDQKCATFEFVRGSSNSTTTLCVNVNENGKVLPPSSGYEYYASSAGTTEAVEISLGNSVGDVYDLGMVFNTSSSDNVALSVCFVQPATGRCLLMGWAYDVIINPNIAEGITFDELVKKIEDHIQEIYANGDTTGFKWKRTSTKVMSSDTTPTEYTLISDSTKRANDAINAFSGGIYKSTDAVGLNNNENVAYLQQQLINYYGFSYYIDKEQACDPNIKTEDIPSDFVKVYFNADNACYIKGPKEHAKDKLSVPSCFKNTCYINSQTADYDGVIALLNQYAKNAHDSSLNPPEGTGVNPGENDFNGSDPGSSDSENGPSNTDQPLCYQAAKTLGWIICPVLEGVGHATSGLYTAIIEPFLTISADFLKTEDSGGSGASGPVRTGWSDFRTFANTLFAIAFVIVILAQITGIGISNYNIKKILPRLIMVVVLVNLSFIICQLAVDVSNILGSGLYNLFQTLAKSMPNAGLGALTNGFMQSLGLTVLTGGALFGLGAIAVTTWEVWLVPLLLALLGCVIGVIFFFIVLAVRQAGVIILIVISPIAIVCYALPNTKSFFDRWKKMFMSLLVVYPICGLLIGGGQYVAALLARTNTDNLFFNLAAMLVQIVPFFMIPSIVRSSMTALGNLGNKIAGFGQRLGGNLQRGIRSSAPVQDWQRSLDMHNAARSYNRAQRSIDRQGGDKKASRSALRRRSRAATRYNRLAYEDIRAGGGAQLLSEDNPAYNALVESESEKQRQENVNGYQTLITNNAMGSAAASGNVNGSSEDELSAELDHYIDETMGGIKSGKSVAELRDNINRAQAYINALSAKGTGSARAKVIQSLSKMMQGYSSDLQNSAYKDRLSSTINTLGAHTLDKYGADYKKDGPGNARMLSDIAAGKYTADNTSFTTVRDGSGKTHLHSEYYSKQGITGASAADFSKMKSRNVSDLLRTLSGGHIDGEEVLAAARLSDSVLSDPNAYQPDTDAIDPMSDVRLAAYGSQVAGTKAGRSAGSQAIGVATTNGLRAIADKIQTAGDWSSMSADDQKYYGGLMSNIHQALQNETFSQADANILHSAAEAAQAKGFQITTAGSSGSTTAAPVDAKDFTARNIKVGTSAQRRLETDLTAGGTYKIDRKKMRQGNIEDAVTRTDGAAMSDDDFDFIYKAQAHNAEVQRWNTENGFGPTPPSSGSRSGSGSGSAP